MGSRHYTVNQPTCRSSSLFPPLLPPPSLPRRVMLLSQPTLMSPPSTLTTLLCRMITLITTSALKRRGTGTIPRDHTMYRFLMVAYRRLPTLSVEMVAMLLMSPMKELLSTLKPSLMFQLLHMELPSRSQVNGHPTTSC